MVERHELGIAEDGEIGGNGGGHPFHDELLESPNRAGDRHIPVATPHDELADEVVVELADLVARLIATVPPDAETMRRTELGDQSRRGQELPAGRILGVYPNLDRVAGDRHIGLGEGDGFSRRHHQLELDQVEPGHELGGRMLDLEAGVHLEVVELTVLVQELDGAGVDVIATSGDGDRRLAHRRQCLGRDPGRRSFFYEFLMAALNRTVAGAQMDTVAVRIGQDLHFDMAWRCQVALHVDLVATEVRHSFALGRLDGIRNLGWPVHHLHATAAAAVGRLDGHRPAVLLAEFLDVDR